MSYITTIDDTTNIAQSEACDCGTCHLPDDGYNAKIDAKTEESAYGRASLSLKLNPNDRAQMIAARFVDPIEFDATDAISRGYTRAIDEMIATGALGPLNDDSADWRGEYKVLWRSGDYRPRRVIYLALWEDYSKPEEQNPEHEEDWPVVRHAFGIGRMVYDKNGFPLFGENVENHSHVNPLALLKRLPKREREGAAAHLKEWLVDVYPDLIDGKVRLSPHPVMTIHKYKHGTPEYAVQRLAVDRAWHMGRDWAN